MAAKNDLDEPEWFAPVTEDIIKCLWSAADPAFQKRVWFDGIGPEFEWYDEFVVSLFDDCIVEEYLVDPYVRSRLTPEQLDKLAIFVARLDAFYERHWGTGKGDDPSLLDDPEWQAIGQLARDALAAFGSTERPPLVNSPPRSPDG